MSCRVDTSLISGACVVGNRGLGALGSVIRATTATGTHGPGYLYNDLTGADDAKEVRGLIVTTPAAGTFVADEDGSFTLAGAPDGAYSFVYRLYVDGADLGTATASIAVGAVSTVTASVAATGGVALTIGGAVALTGNVSDAAPGDVTASVAATGGVVVTVGGVVALTGGVSDAAPGGALSDAEMRQMFSWVQDLARIHGLVVGAPLVVTPTSRSAGPVNQSIAELGSTVTVSRS